MIELINRKGISTIVYKKQNKDEIIQYVLANKVNSIYIGDGDIDIDSSIDFLREMVSIEYLTISALVENKPDILYNLKIKSLELHRGEWPIDFSKLNAVEYVELIYNKKINFKGICSSLKKLHVKKYKQKQLDEYFNENNITELFIAQSQLESLKGLENFPKLEKLTIALSPKLVDISDLKYVSKTLKYLELESCKSLADFSVLEKLTNIEEINLYNIESISTTGYFKNLSKLQTLFLRGNSKVLKRDKNDVSHIKKVVIADMDLMIGC